MKTEKEICEIDKLLNELKIKSINGYEIARVIYRFFEINGQKYCLSFCPIKTTNWVFNCEDDNKMLYVGYSRSEVKIIIKDILEGRYK